MDRNALDWLFSTAPQAIAALVGLIVASASFILGKVDDRIEADSTLAEIGREAKKQIYIGLKKLLIWTLYIIGIDLLCLYLNPIGNDRIIAYSGELNWYSVYFIVSFIVLSINVYVLYRAFEYVKEMMDPEFFDKTIQLLSKRESEGNVEAVETVEIGEFIKHFIEFEKLIRSSSVFARRNYPRQKQLPISQMIWDLKNREYLTKDEYSSLKNINRLRNIVMHEGDIPRVKKETDDELIRITQKLQEILPKMD